MTRQLERYFWFCSNCDIHVTVADPGNTPLLSFMYICVAAPIWRRLLVSFVAFALSKVLVKAGTTSAASMVTVAITTSNSIRVKARSKGGGELLIMDFVGLGRMILRLSRERKAKRGEKARLLDKAFGILCM